MQPGNQSERLEKKVCSRERRKMRDAFGFICGNVGGWGGGGFLGIDANNNLLLPVGSAGGKVSEESFGRCERMK